MAIEFQPPPNDDTTDNCAAFAPVMAPGPNVGTMGGAAVSTGGGPGEADDLRADYLSLGLTLGRHPMSLLREQDDAPFTRCKTAKDLERIRHGRFVQVSGIVTGRQRPASASGVLFLTLEDETDNINVVIWTRILETYRSAVVQGRLLKIKGVLERQESVIHVIAGHVEDLSHYLEHFSLKSRDFR